MLSILRRANNINSFSLLSAPFTFGLLSAALLLLVVQTAACQTDSSASGIEYEIVLPIPEAPSFGAFPRHAPLHWQGEWLRRFSPRAVVVQNGWKYRTSPRDDDVNDSQQRIVLRKKWTALEPSIRFL